jgi:hypothetical protein
MIEEGLLHKWKGCEWAIHSDNYETLVWYTSSVPKPCLEEVLEAYNEYKIEEAMRLLRIERNDRLMKSDWVILRAFCKNEVVPNEWLIYMQALRDLPDDSEPRLNLDGKLDMSSVHWPVMPEA